MRDTDTLVHPPITEKSPNNYTLEGFYRRNVVYLMVFDGRIDMSKWENSAADGFYLGMVEDQDFLYRLCVHISRTHYLPELLSLWIQTGGFNEHTAAELETYLHQRLANHLAVEWGINVNDPMSFRNALETIKEADKTGFKCGLKRFELHDLCVL